LDGKVVTDFLGFDGFFGRGQVDALGGTGKKRTWDGDVFMDIVFVGGATQTLEFAGDTKKDDIGAIGFDEIKEPSLFIDSAPCGWTRPRRGTRSSSSTSRFPARRPCQNRRLGRWCSAPWALATPVSAAAA
jgi:hypothetical protein